MIFVFLCLTSLSIMVCRSIHVTANGVILLFFMAQEYSIVYVYHIYFIHSSVDGHLGCLHVLATVNSAAVNIGVHVSFQIMVNITNNETSRLYAAPDMKHQEQDNIHVLSLPKIHNLNLNMRRPSLVAQMVKNLPAVQETWV